ncbi:MAG: hypothetical protein HY321_09040 [Armatimonadetes bacterium]|nr:hypothetical protein [Armatimonadota bacterium]
MSDESAPQVSPAGQRVEEALEILAALDLPRGQRNERSALVLLALAEPGSACPPGSHPYRRGRLRGHPCRSRPVGWGIDSHPPAAMPYSKEGASLWEKRSEYAG